MNVLLYIHTINLNGLINKEPDNETELDIESYRNKI